MDSPPNLAEMNPEALREFAAQLLGKLAQKDETIRVKQLKIDQLTHEMAILKRWRFGRRSEQFESGQRSLLEESIDEDLGAISIELEALQEPPAGRPAKQKPRRLALPGHLPRREIRHEPQQTECSCGCALERIGEDVSEKLGYTPGLFEVERHIRGKWVCRRCERLIQAPVPAQVINKGLPTASLLAQVLVAKFADHQPLYRQEGIFERAGLAIPRSTLAEWSGTCGVRLEPLWCAQRAHLLRRTVVHADETPVPMLKPGLGHTHRAYLWSYGTTEYDPAPIVVYDFAESRSGQHARTFLVDWMGTLICDDYVGYKALFKKGAIEAGCMAHYPELSIMPSLIASAASTTADPNMEALDNTRAGIIWKRGRRAGRASEPKGALARMRGPSGSRTSPRHRASFAGSLRRTDWSSRCWRGRDSHG